MKVRNVLIGAALAALGAAASATPTIRTDFLKTLKIKDTSSVARAQCALCHAGGPPKLNPFGQDLKKAMKAKNARTFTLEVGKQIQNVDSDKDGFSNWAEIKADTLPGDPKSKPGAAKPSPKKKK